MVHKLEQFRMAICGPFQACTRSPLCTPGRVTPTAWAPTGTQGRVPIAPTGTRERVLIAPTGTQTRTGTRYRSQGPLCPLWSSPKIGRTVFAGFFVLPSDRRGHSEPSWGFKSPLSHSYLPTALRFSAILASWKNPTLTERAHGRPCPLTHTLATP